MAVPGSARTTTVTAAMSARRMRITSPSRRPLRGRAKTAVRPPTLPPCGREHSTARRAETWCRRAARIGRRKAPLRSPAAVEHLLDALGLGLAVPTGADPRGRAGVVREVGERRGGILVERVRRVD